MEETSPRVTYLTAGAGGMYCGSCIRDNALATELQALGWDVTLAPLYTPIRTDEKDHSIDQVFFGGINVYLQQKIPLFRRLPGFFDRFLDNPNLIRRVTARSMTVDAAQLGAMTLSMVKGEDGYQRREVKKLLHWLESAARPDLICLTNLLVGGSIPAIKRQLEGVPILVTLQGDDVFLDELIEPWKSKVLAVMRKLAVQADGFITFSEHYRDRMAALLEIDTNKFQITPLGIDTAAFEEVYEKRKEREPGSVIGYFARICPEKGFDVLVSAFLELAAESNDYRLLCGGWLSDKDRDFFEEQKEKIRRAGLAERFEYVGSPDEEGKKEFFQRIDIFSVPARFFEPKGLYVLEAFACGIPVIAPQRGVFCELIGASGGGELFEPEDPGELAAKLKSGIGPEAGKRARNWVVQFADRRAMAEATAKVFRNTLGERTGEVISSAK